MHISTTWVARLRRPRNGPVFNRLLASFLAMLILPFATLLFNYLYARELLRQENLNYQNAVLIQAQMMVDEKLQSLQQFALDMQNDQTISSFLMSRNLSGSELQMEIWHLSQYLGGYAATYRDLCECFVYSINYDYLISARSADSGVSSQVIRMDSWELNRQLQKLLLEPRQFCQYAVLRDGASSALVMLHSVPLWSTGQSEDGTICLLIDTAGLFRNIAEMQELQAGLVCLLDENGQVIVSTGDTALQGSVAEAIARGEGFLTINGARYTVSVADSGLNGWSYLSIQPQHAVLPRLRFTRNLSLGIFALVLGIGIAAAYLLSRRNYRPLEHLMDALRRQSGLLREQADSDENEFRFIERSVQDLSASMGAMHGLLQDEMPRIQEGMLLQLLHNAVTDFDAYTQTLADMGILLPYRRFGVAVIHQPENEAFEEQAIVNVIAKEQLVRLMPPTIPYATVGVQSNMLVVILNSDAEDFEALAANAMQALADSLRSEFSRMVEITLSRIVPDIRRVPHAYYTAAETKPAHPGGEITLLSRQPPVRVEQSLDEIATPLRNYVATGDVDRALQLLQTRYRHGIEGQALAPHTLWGYYVGMLNLITSACTLEEGTPLMPDGTDPLAVLFVQQTAAEMEATVEQVTRQLCQAVQNNQKTHATQLTDQILAFLQREYANGDLTLSYVADHFYITSSYLSTFFKENVGDTFLNYLTKLRIDHAKQLIRTTNLPMGEIATKVGYASGNTFTRIFKKVEGITPTQYRESGQ